MNTHDPGEDAKSGEPAGDPPALETTDEDSPPDEPHPETKLSAFLTAACHWVLSRH